MTTQMWTVPLRTANDEIGPQEVERLRMLRRWLYPEMEGELTFRVAPSLVARCEVELFDVSMPRFAFRAYLAPGSFVNARRIETFCRLATSWGRPPAGYGDYVDLAAMKQGPDSTMRRSSCIGDSLLMPPHRLGPEHFHVLTTPLGWAYGEQEEIRGTPFVNHVRLGGGLCAQAVCFMATALLQETTRGIYGVAEITAIASDQDARILNLGGMTAEKICSYFNHPQVGLGASLQIIPVHQDEVRIRAWQYGEALRSYVLSDAPVVILVDLGRMCGVKLRKEDDATKAVAEDTYLFAHNDLHEKIPIVKMCREKLEPQPRNHAVLAVGCRIERGGDAAQALEFLINDPSTYPFLKADAAELADVRIYHESHWQDGELSPIKFIPVTPREVRLPLMSILQDQQLRRGLIDIATVIQIDARDPRLPGLAPVIDPRGEIRLVDLRWCEDKDEVDPLFHKRLVHLPVGVRERVIQLVQEGEVPAKWCWLQWGPAEIVPGEEIQSVWIWDATVPAPLDDNVPTDQLRRKYLLAVLVEENSGWNRLYVSPKPLNPAMISSFRTREMPEVRRQWPSAPVPAVDLYVFMQPEVEGWLQANGQPPGPPRGPNSAMAVMAQLAEEEAVIDEWARSACKSFPPMEMPIVALTSFVPEVTSPQEESYQRAAAAIGFLVEFARALKRQGHRELRTIELVTGSRIGGIWPWRSDRYVATRMDADEACRRMLSILTRVVSRFTLRRDQDPVFLALELEPGPMYLLRDWRSLVELCREIGKDPMLSRFVGVNLDIAHWRLARDIAPAQVWDTLEVRNRIVHAHFAGHHRCSHLGDIPPNDLNRPEDFRPWIDLLRQIAADWRAPDLPQFSGFVSLELEAAKDRNLVTESVEKLVSLIWRGTW